MKCWQIERRKSLVRYVTGDLRGEETRQIEDHLTDCGRCRDQVARLRAGHRFASQLPSVSPRHDVWENIEGAIEAAGRSATRRIPDARGVSGWRSLWQSPYMGVGALALAVLVGAALVLSSVRHRTVEPETAGLKSLEAVDLREFSPVRIDEIQQNTKPHVVAEGYVSEVGINDEDGDLSFKLVDKLGEQRQFIVCEIIDPIKLTPPPVGSRVRVYGVSRYDGDRDHNWYEVHPVLNIEVVR